MTRTLELGIVSTTATERASTLRIACIGWGSLIWDRRNLSIVSATEGWYVDGPYLPIEFARQSLNDRLTLVICGGAAPVQVLWAHMDFGTLEEARINLADREGSNLIGTYPAASHLPYGDVIARWAKAKNLDGVVWTALGPKFDGVSNRIPTEVHALTYLKHLVSSGRGGRAEQYVRYAPPQIATAYRSAIERELGWTSRDSNKGIG